MTPSGPLGALLVSLFLGAAALAVWVELQISTRRKEKRQEKRQQRGRVVVLHVAAALLLLSVVPQMLVLLAKAVTPAWTALGVFGVFLPALVYAFLASLWSLTYVRDTYLARNG